jgi:hypothetical protein
MVAGMSDKRIPSDDEIARRCTFIADQVVPKYRHSGRSYSCGGVIAHKWQAAWDAACIALGADPATYLSPPLSRLPA